MSSAVVVDASVVLKWVLVEADSPLANALADEWLRDRKRILAPGLIAYEAANILRQQVRKGAMQIDDATIALPKIFAGGLHLDAVDEFGQATLGQRAIELAHQFGLPAAYDAHYLALAEREGCDYWTADQRLWNTVKATLPWVRWLGTYTPASPAPGSP